MSNVIGICNLHNEPHLGEITKNRPLAALSFLGRYGIIDFTLSNFSNSHIDRVYVLVRKGIVSIRKHIGSGSIWTNNTRLGHIELLINEKAISNKPFNTDLNNLKTVIDVEELDYEYAVIAPTHFLSSMDFRPIIEAHKNSGAQITAVYTHVNNANRQFVNCRKYKVDGDKIVDSTRNFGRTEEADISLETYIINKKALRKLLKDSEKVSQLYSINDMINFYINEKTLDINGYCFDGFVVPILTLDDYINHSLDLLNYHIRSKLFLEDWPIYTTTHNTAPALYGKDAEVQNSFIANGAIIKGKVINSIISREVVIEKNAEVKNSIIFTKTLVSKEAKLDHVLCDKNVKIINAKRISGTDDEVIVISQGANI